MNKSKTSLLFLTAITFSVLTGCTIGKSSIESEYNLPKGSRFIEIIPIDNMRWSAYVIFEFRGQCFMKYGLGRRGGLANIECPTTH